MNINWRLKSKIFQFIDIFGANKLLYFVQKHITKRASINISDIYKDSKLHVNFIKNYGFKAILEFGGGKSLAQNILFSQFSNEQTVVDLNAMIDFNLFNIAALELSRRENKINYNKCVTLSDLKLNYGISYLAPFDVSNTNFKKNSFDCCISTNTLEHIPKEQILRIFKELRRIIKKNGLILAYIDYSDHYSHTDKSINQLNFLKFSSKEWKAYNHSSHYQNRLRHYDYIDIFKNLNFKILTSKAFFENVEGDVPISNEFQIDKKSLKATSGFFALKL